MKATPKAPTRAWTGGFGPAPYREMNEAQRLKVREIFRDQIEHHCGRTWFFSTPFGVLDYARILWNRAKYDTWASLNLN